MPCWLVKNSGELLQGHYCLLVLYHLLAVFREPFYRDWKEHVEANWRNISAKLSWNHTSIIICHFVYFLCQPKFSFEFYIFKQFWKRTTKGTFPLRLFEICPFVYNEISIEGKFWQQTDNSQRVIIINQLESYARVILKYVTAKAYKW